MKRLISVLGLCLAISAQSFSEAKTPSRSTKRPKAKRPPVGLVWHAETLGGQVVETRGGDDTINPASVVKVATSWWALEKLGPEHRFETRILARGRIDARRGVLDGDLVVEGSGDPDFQAENAFLIAAALNRLDVRQVSGALIVNHRFWIGWEDGSAGRDPDPAKRASLMGHRLRRALDSKHWDRATHAAWNAFANRRGLYAKSPPRVAIFGAVKAGGEVSDAHLLLVHRSKPLADTLRRFNCFSNNDIERVGVALGTVDELSSLLTSRIDAPPAAIRLQTTSGLGENRITPRLVVRMMREFRRTSERVGMAVESLLPVAGCDPGTVTRFFPRFTEGANATALVGKTGTLTATDGGISVLAGFLNTAEGEMVFCIAAPRSAGRARSARRAEERWLLDLLAKHGGPQPRTCAPPLGTADAEADVVLAVLGRNSAPAASPSQGAARTAP